MSGTLQELRLAVRRLGRARGFAATTVVTLALGIGCTTVVFSVVETVLLRPLPFARPETLVVVRPPVPVAFWDMVEQCQNSTDVFDQTGVYVERAANLSGDGEAERILVARVSVGFLPVVGTSATVGRSFLDRDFQAGLERVVLLTHGLWRRRYGGSPDAIGRVLRLDGQSYTIVGVLPSTFRTVAQIELGQGASFDVDVGALIPFSGRPLVGDLTSTDGAPRGVTLIGRLRDGVSFARARSVVATIAKRTMPANPDVAFSLVPLAEAVSRQLPRQLAILSAAVGVLMLVGLGNVANLLLERLHARRCEMAVRTALGASSGHLAVSVLAETMWLALVGGVAGVLTAWGGIHAVRIVASPMVTGVAEIALNLRVLGFAVVLAVGTGLLLGVVPALRLSRLDAAGGLRADASAPRVRGRLAVPSLLVVAQVALAVVLVVAGALAARAFARSLPADLRYRTEGVLTAEVSLDRARYTRAATTRFFNDLLERAAALPGAERAAMVAIVPGGRFGVVTQMQVDGLLPEFTRAQEISEDFFSVLSIPILAGRSLTRHDTAEAPRVVLVNEAFARKHWGSAGGAINQQMTFWGGPQWTVVGVAADARDAASGWELRPTVYLNHRQWSPPSTQMTLLLRARHDDPAALTRPLLQLVRALDPDQPLCNVLTLRHIVYAKFAPRRLMVATMTLFAGLTLLLAALGVHGVMAYAVALRRHEIGVRRALGATNRAIAVLVMGRAVALLAAGAVLGLPVVVGLVWFGESEMFDLAGADLPTCLGGVVVVGVAGLCASLSSVLRATGVNPITTLRNE